MSLMSRVRKPLPKDFRKLLRVRAAPILLKECYACMDLLKDITAALVPYGLNLIGAAARATYESLVPVQYHVSSVLPETRSIIVIGNGGRAFWTVFREHASARPGYFQKYANPLDDYTVEAIENSLTPLLQRSGATFRYVYPFRFSTQPLSFMHLAQAADLAGPSILGIVIHPTYGPWMALRAAILIDHIDQELGQSPAGPPPAQGFDPCPSCTERSCIKACPANVVSLETGWDTPGCVRHRLRVRDDCNEYCHARYQCVYGREHRYPPEELQYHQTRSRETMRAYLEKDD